ncbi:MAG: hypothetical protein ACI9EF_001960 [Pseudohongiellaceae bacterium]|jgi:hypothetical protein
MLATLLVALIACLPQVGATAESGTLPARPGLYTLQVDQAEGFPELPTTVWLSDVPVQTWGIGRLVQSLTEGEKQTYPWNTVPVKDSEWFLLDPPLPPEHPFRGRAQWTPTDDGGVVLMWGGFSALQVSLSLVTAERFQGTASRFYDVGPGGPGEQLPSVLAPIDLSPRDTTELRIRRFEWVEAMASAHGRVAGRVVRQANGCPLPKATVEVLAEPRPPQAGELIVLGTTKISRSGAFLFEGLDCSDQPTALRVTWQKERAVSFGLAIGQPKFVELRPVPWSSVRLCWRR